MAERCTKKGFYLQGVKVASGAAFYDAEGGPCTVVVGRDAGVGEIAAKDLPDGVLLRLPSSGLSLRFVRSEMHGRIGRAKFDPSRFSGDDRDAYVALAVESMAFGARESADYVETVLRAAAPGPKVAAALLARCQRVLDVGFQQYDEVEGARLLAHLVGFARTGEAIPLDWVEKRLDGLTHWYAFAMLSSPGTLPAPVEDAMLSRALDRVRADDAEALPGYPTGVLDGSRSDVERIRLRGDLLRLMASRPTIDNQLSGREGRDRHREFFVDAFLRSALLAEASPQDPEIRARLRAAAEEEVDSLLAVSSGAPAGSPQGGSRNRRPPASPTRNARRREARRHPPLVVLERAERDAERALAARMRELGASDADVVGMMVDPSTSRWSPPNAGDAAETRALVDDFKKASASARDAREVRYARAERMALTDAGAPRTREKGSAPRRPMLVESSLAHLEGRVGVVCEGLLGFLLDADLDAVVPQARATVQRRVREDVERHRLELARSFELESRVRRDDGRPRPSLFDANGPGVSLSTGFAWFDDTQANRSVDVRTAPKKGSEEARLLEDPLFVRARLVHAALFPADDRFLEDIRLLVLANGGPAPRARLSKTQAWQAVRNLETALYAFTALTGAWRGAALPLPARTDYSGLAYLPEEERSLMLPDWAKECLAAMRSGEVRLGGDPLRGSFHCLAALREFEYCWQRLRREVQGALATPAVRRSKERTREHQSALPYELPEQLRRAVRNLTRPGGGRGTDRGPRR